MTPLAPGRIARDAIARWIWHPTQQALRTVRSGQRAAQAAYREGMRFRTRAADWPAERRTEWMRRRLRDAVRYAAATSPFYEDRLKAAGLDPQADFDFADYARLPVLEREEVREAGRRLRSRAVPDAEAREDATGGSTGTPTRIWRGPRERGWAESGREFHMTHIGLPPGARLAYLWGHHLDPMARDSFRERAQDWLGNVSWYDCLRLSDDVLLRYHQRLQRERPAGMIAYAGALATLADALDRAGERPRYPTTALVTGAEKLFAHQRELVERVFGVPVHERYGARDTGLMGFQRSATSRDFDVDWAQVLVEPEFDADNGEPSAILVTKLQADAMPMLRYRVGDLARFPVDARPGHPTFVLHEVVGRDTQRLWLPDGGWVHGISFPHLFKDHPVSDFQVAQQEDLSVEVRIVPAAEFTEAHADEIVRLVRANLPGLPVSLRRVERIARTKSNKWQPVTSAVRPPRPTAASA